MRKRVKSLDMITNITPLLSLPLTELVSSSESVGQDALKFLHVLKKEKPGSGSIAASANDLQKVIRQLERLAGVSRSERSVHT